MNGSFQAITVVGGVLPPAMLGRIQSGNLQDRNGLAPASYFLSGRETIGDAASRSWSYLKGVWQDWQEIDSRKGALGPGTGDARQRWLLILLRELGYGPVAPAGSEIEDRSSYPVSHLWGSVPIHLLGPRVQLDKRNPGVEGAAKAPQKMLQELLNHSADYLWGVLSNGLKLRLLRDSTALAGSAYIEFDLETIFTAELYPEFQLLWQLCHQSRLASRAAESGPESCWLESWRSEAVESGSRALDRLGIGVQHALERLGTGLLRHPDNAWLIAALRTDDLSRHDFHKALLRTAYRLLFCFVVEDRGALHTPEASAEAKRRYAEFFSTRRLRDLSRKHDGGPHPDLWQTQKLILRALGGDGLDALGLPALGGLFDPDPRATIPATQPGPDLALGCEIANRDLLRAVRSLAWVKNPAGRIEPVDYRHLGAEELGSVYESLLELVPRLDLESKTFTLENVAGNERKVTGSYYTPPNLVSALLDTALDPLLDEAVRAASDSADAERRLLELTVCDPASGSGGFLVAAARRMARRLAEVRAGQDEPTPEDVRQALHDVVDGCIYGVDMNDLAAELAKVSLWLESMEPGKPLTFLDSRIKIGNSLMGATPALMDAGIPDDAFKPLEGDLKTYASEIRKTNKAEAKAKSGQYIQHLGQDAFNIGREESSFEQLITDRERLNRPVSSVADARRLAREYAAFDESDDLNLRRLEADTWCASFVWPLNGEHPKPPTNSVFRNIGAAFAAGSLAETIGEVARLRDEYRFFHWYLEFPEIFGDPAGNGDNGPEGWPGGFSCVIGNPPWERVKLQEPEFFASRDPEIASATKAKRKVLISKLQDPDDGNPWLHLEFVTARRHADSTSHFLRTSGRYPLCGHGDVNTYAVFAESFTQMVSPHGQTGFIVKTGLVTDDTYKRYPAFVLSETRLHSLFDFENRANGKSENGKSKLYFENVDSREKFSLITVGGRKRTYATATLAFFVPNVEGRMDSSLSLSPENIELMNPISGTLPIFRSSRDAEITLSAYQRFGTIRHQKGSSKPKPWDVALTSMFHMSNDVDNFNSRVEFEANGWQLVGNVFTRENTNGHMDRMLPLFESKMLHQFNHRWATFNDGEWATTPQPKLDSPNYDVLPRYWISEDALVSKVPGATTTPEWLIGWRKLARATDERTAIGLGFPTGGISDSANLIVANDTDKPYLLLILNSFMFDYVARQKVGGTNFNIFHLAQLPFPSRDQLQNFARNRLKVGENWLTDHASELVYTSNSAAPFAQILGDSKAPFRFDPDRRAIIRAEVDAFFFHLFGANEDTLHFVLDSFEVAKSNEESKFGEYRSKRLILQSFLTMNDAMESGVAFVSSLVPPPGSGARHDVEERV